MLQLPPPEPDRWRRAITAAAAGWAAHTASDGALRLVYSRGRESGSAPTAYLSIAALPDRIAAVRRDGLAAVLLDRGLPADAADTMPWLLAGAKTLSYAINMAALRYAAERDAGDVIFVSSDGLILEGPRSTVVIATGEPDNPCFLTRHRGTRSFAAPPSRGCSISPATPATTVTTRRCGPRTCKRRRVFGWCRASLWRPGCIRSTATGWRRAHWPPRWPGWWMRRCSATAEW